MDRGRLQLEDQIARRWPFLARALGERILLTCSGERSADGTILCLSTEDGRIVWECGYETETRVQHADNCFASSTPVVDEKCVYVTWGSTDQLTLLALDHNGQQKWRRNLGVFQCGHGSAISPILCGDLVVLANDDRAQSFLVAVDPDTGSVIWQISELPRNTPSTRWISSPTTSHGLVIATYAVGSHGLEVIAVRPGSKTKNTVPLLEYTIETCVPSVPSPLVNGDLLFLCTNDGVLSCHRVLTGERLWSERLGADFLRVAHLRQ